MSKGEATIWEHLEELVIRLRRALLALFIASVVVPFLPNPLTLLEGGGYSPLLFSVHYFIRGYVIPDSITVGGKTIEIHLVSRDPFAGIKLTLYTMLLIGVVVAGPYMAYEIYAFLKPALYPHEERALKRGALASAALFFIGALLALFVLLPITYRIMFTMMYLIAGELAAYADYSE
ncbi:MAG: twin-arginine translocase subunit TatC, partial [Acidilobaceae archaeon]